MRPNDNHALTSVALGPAVVVTVLAAPRKLVNTGHWRQTWHRIVAVAHHQRIELLRACCRVCRTILAATTRAFAARLCCDQPRAGRITAAVPTNLRHSGRHARAQAHVVPELEALGKGLEVAEHFVVRREAARISRLALHETLCCSPEQAPPQSRRASAAWRGSAQSSNMRASNIRHLIGGRGLDTYRESMEALATRGTGAPA